MKIVKLIVALAAVALAGAQFWPVDQSNPPVGADLSAPPEVSAILRRACYDCHSNETRWPWYTHIARVSWVMAYDVHEGRRSMNYSNWGKLDEGVRTRLLRLTRRDVDNARMPPWFYIYPMHPEARLAAGDRIRIAGWTEAARSDLIRKFENGHNTDSAGQH
jgi:hypothetical protein